MLKSSGPALPHEMVQSILDAMPLAVAVLDSRFGLIAQNAKFVRRRLQLDALQRLAAGDQNAFDFSVPCAGGSVVEGRLHRAGTGYCVVLNQPQQMVSLKEQLLTVMLRALHEGEDLYKAAVQALAICLGWRWIGITAFAGNGKIDVLAWWDTDHLSRSFSYEIAGTPCERMVKKGSFCSFERVATLFPKDAPLQALGAQSYAGAVYRGADNKAVGHIYMFDDREQLDMMATEEILNLMSILVGTELRLRHTTKIAEHAVKQVRTDALTGLANRQGFDDDGARFTTSYPLGESQDAVLAIVDLDGMKTINDTRGHEAGDQLLQTFADYLQRTSRTGDKFYRLGGDEFAMLFVNAGENAGLLLHNRIHRVVEQVRQAGFPEMDASVGLASLTEADGQLMAAVRLADKRMYADKQAKRAGSQKA